MPAQPVTRPIQQFFQISLLGLLVSGFLALGFSTFLDTPTIILTAIGFTVRAASLSSRGARWQLPAPLANALTLAYIGFYPLDYMYLSREFIPAAVHLICFLAVVRILSARTNRDYFFVKVIAFLNFSRQLCCRRTSASFCSSYCSLSSASPHSAVRKYGGPVSSRAASHPAGLTSRAVSPQPLP